MAEILVSSIGGSGLAFQKYRPSYVISILDEDEPIPPIFSALPSERHLKLIDDSFLAGNNGLSGDASQCKKLISLAERWDLQSPVLIHCHRGVARSMAAAYILMCAIEKNSCEKALAARLRQAAPHADPNILLVSEADALMGRNDRMIEAILDLCPSSGTISAPIVTLPVEA